MAQSGVEVETTAPAPPKFEIIRPEAKGSEITRPRDADIYRGDPVINYDPAFIEPFTKETATGRMGLAGGRGDARRDVEHAAARMAELRLRHYLGWTRAKACRRTRRYFPLNSQYPANAPCRS